MTTTLSRSIAGPGPAGPRMAAARAADGLTLAAAPAFAAMAALTALGGAPLPLCTGMSALPLQGMPVMYLLMALFHLPPWLRRLSAPARPA